MARLGVLLIAFLGSIDIARGKLRSSQGLGEVNVHARAEMHSAAIDPLAAASLTVASIFTTTETSTQRNPLAPMTRQVWVTKATITILEPYSATVFPTTIVQTGISDMDFTYLATPAAGSIYSSIWSGLYTNPTTWALHKPQATDLPAGTRKNDLPCAQCAAQTLQQDSRCTARSLNTACQGQCDQKEGIWWCRQLRVLEFGTDREMGRACWGNLGDYGQLLEPCLSGDYSIGCQPCQGNDTSWMPKTWLW